METEGIHASTAGERGDSVYQKCSLAVWEDMSKHNSSHKTRGKENKMFETAALVSVRSIDSSRGVGYSGVGSEKHRAVHNAKKNHDYRRTTNSKLVLWFFIT